MIKKNQIKASLDSRKKPLVHYWYLWGTSTNTKPTEKEISLDANNAEGFCSLWTWCRWLTNWPGRCSAGSVHQRTEEMIKDVKAKGSLGCNDYETMKFKLSKKIRKKSRRIIKMELNPCISQELIFNYLGICLAGSHCQELWKVEAQQSLISKGTFLYPFRYAESKASLAEGQQR